MNTMKTLLVTTTALAVAAAAFLGATPAAHSAAATSCAITIYPRYGTYAHSGRLHGPGLVLAGGGALEAPKSIFTWLHDRVMGPGRGRAGNVVVLRASDDDLYDKPFAQYGRFASVQTILIPPCAPASQVDRAAPVVDTADAVFFAGGDQSHYVAWKNTALMAAVKRLYARGGVVGGGSAGLAIQGAVIYDAVAADRFDADTHTPDAVADPLEKRISFTTGLFDWPALADTITDTHLVVRDRFGRMVVFLARILHDGLLPGATSAYALGIDQASAVVVGPNGVATVLNAPGGRGAYLVRATAAPDLTPGRPIRYTVEVAHIGHDGERFDLLHKTTHEPWYSVTVDGSHSPIYSRDPYRP
jgi:cyanophycinase-like exopeptidase